MEDWSVLVKRRKEGKISPTQMLQHFHFEPLQVHSKVQFRVTDELDLVPDNFFCSYMDFDKLGSCLKQDNAGHEPAAAGGNGVQCVDEKAANLSRIMANRQSAARLKERKARYHMYPNLKEKCIPTYTIPEGYIKSDYRELRA
ncbi:LOW QUALITY PROTEIN: hypothetical protein NC651_039996 [Populus alba x Populus x berolinensis]|nr:LOW QUALITY PROTEIN: hypothetical protein NC651_039996 [Populus alba x Populus x berolinensis]